MKLVVSSFSLLFHCVTIFGLEPPPALCAQLLNQGVAGTTVSRYFSPSMGHVYENVSPSLKLRLIAASVAMMSAPSVRPGKLQFAGVNGGIEAIGHLWLLGEAPERISAYARPLLDESFQTRVLPGIEALNATPAMRQLEGFWLSEKPIYPTSLLARDAQMVRALNAKREPVPHSLSSFAETNLETLQSFIDGSLFANAGGHTFSFLEYMVLLNESGLSVAMALEKFGMDESLLRIGNNFAFESLKKLRSGKADLTLRSSLVAAIQALARVKRPELKKQANAILLSFAKLMISAEFFNAFEPLADDQRASLYFDYYDLALQAAQATGTIVTKGFAAGETLEITYQGVDSEAWIVIRLVADAYFRQGEWIAEPHLRQIRKSLVAIGDSDRLKRNGKKLYESGQSLENDWRRSIYYAAAFDFFMAANDRDSALLVVNTWTRGFLSKNRAVENEWRKLDALEFEMGLVKKAIELNHPPLLTELLNFAEQQKWEIAREALLAAVQGRTWLSAADRFPPSPEIPSGLTLALASHWTGVEAIKALGSLNVNERSLTLAAANSDLLSGDYHSALRAFALARSAKGLERLGDELMTLHISSPGTTPDLRLGQLAHRAYLFSALIQNESRGQ